MIVLKIILMKNKCACTQKHCLNIATLEITFLFIHHDRLSPTSHFVKSHICYQDEVVLSCCRYILLLFIIITKFLLVTFNFAIIILCLSQCPLLSTERIAVVQILYEDGVGRDDILVEEVVLVSPEFVGYCVSGC